MSAKFTWTYNPDALVGKLEGVLKARKLTLVRQIFNGVVMRTPVRTGSARASWRVSLNQPDLSNTVSANATSPLPPPIFPLVEIPPYAKVFISNTTPYIIPLEFGWSKQAPAGMLRVTLGGLKVFENVQI